MMLPSEAPTTHFGPVRLDIGPLRVGQVGHAQFARQADGRHVVSVRPGCGCTEVQFTDTSIRAELTIDTFPDQISEQGKTEYMTAKHVQVIYDDQTFDTLWLDALIRKN